MRTTLDIDEAVLAAIKELAQREGKSCGAVLSELARRALTSESATAAAGGVSEAPAAYGFRPLPAAELVTNALIDKLRDEQGI